MAWKWSRWRLFPNPQKGESLNAPFGAGCYELKLGPQKIIVGCGGNVAFRMTSLLPKPDGTGTRRNKEKREFTKANLGRIEYRTIAFENLNAAKQFEANLRAQEKYKFPS